MTKGHKEIAESVWFQFFGEYLLSIAILAPLSPFYFALWLIHSGELAFGLAAFYAWALADTYILWRLNRAGYLRWAISGPCTIVGVFAAYISLWGIQ